MGTAEKGPTPVRRGGYIRRPEPTKTTDAQRESLERLLTEFLAEQAKKIANQVVEAVERK